jgi:hypothetical protein
MLQAPLATLTVEKGTCYLLFAYDVGISIDLDEADRCITATKQRETIKHKHRAPDYFEYHPAPLRISETVDPLPIAQWQTRPVVDLVLYDFGAVSILYTISLEGPFSGLLSLSESLYDNAMLLSDSRKRLEHALEVIRRAVRRPYIADSVEDYVVFQIESFNRTAGVDDLCTNHALEVAQILRAERQTLSAQEINDALSCRISYGTHDVMVIDWNATLMIDSNGADGRAVLEFANVELLEMRYLDQSLDDALDRAYEALAKRWSVLSSSAITDMRRISRLQVDSAILYEGVNNALKLLGDQYLARMYRLVSQRFHLAEWDASIMRKLETLESIYEKIYHRVSTRRLEVLEWIIIFLIAISIVIPFIL